jgi:hypothetical protein
VEAVHAPGPRTLAFGGAFLGLHASLTILSKLLDMAGEVLRPNLAQRQRQRGVSFVQVVTGADGGVRVAEARGSRVSPKLDGSSSSYTRRVFGLEEWGRTEGEVCRR